MHSPRHHATIFLEEAEILSQQAYSGEQFILRLHAPRCAAHAGPGSFAHLQCHALQPMRRPLSIMRTAPTSGWVEFLYKAVGTGTRLLSGRTVGEKISLLGPIGRTFQVGNAPLPLLIGGGVGIPPMIFLAEALRLSSPPREPLVLMGSELPFPFATRVSGQQIAGIAPSVDLALEILAEWGIPSRLSSLQGFRGCHLGYVTDLARGWLNALGSRRREVAIFACGPHAMLEAVAALARGYDLPCQVSLEEFMACAVGGCAGCTVEIRTPQGLTMRRVCVDGPVFDAQEVFG